MWGAHRWEGKAALCSGEKSAWDPAWVGSLHPASRCRGLSSYGAAATGSFDSAAMTGSFGAAQGRHTGRRGVEGWGRGGQTHGAVGHGGQLGGDGLADAVVGLLHVLAQQLSQAGLHRVQAELVLGALLGAAQVGGQQHLRQEADKKRVCSARVCQLFISAL